MDGGFQMKKALFALTFLLALALMTPPALADIVFTGSSGNRAASANFQNIGGDLVITLTNTSTADVLVPVDVLTGLFFDISASLTPVSALLNSSTVAYGPDGGGNVGGEWRYEAGLAAPGGASKGIYSAGFGFPGDAANFNGANLQNPAALDGLQYGITSAGDNLATGNAPVTGGNALIQNSVVFTLSGISPGFNPDSTNITNVSFQYGTALNEPNVPGTSVPDGGVTLVLLGSALMGVETLRRKLSA
jgi:hypothetical protein